MKSRIPSGSIMAAQAGPCESEKALLSVRRLRVRYSGLIALDVASLDIPARSGVVSLLMGPNGAGKTTLLNSITGYAQCDAGASIILHGSREHQVTHMTRPAIVRAGVARTFQVPPIFASLIVSDLILLAALFSGRRSWWRLGPPPWSLEYRLASKLARRLVEELGLSAVAHMRLSQVPPDLLRWVELARCLATRPRLLMLDEPSSGADDETREHLARFLTARLPQLLCKLEEESTFQTSKMAICVVTHDIALARALATASPTPPLLHMFDHGRLFASGQLDDVLSQPRVREVYLGER